MKKKLWGANCANSCCLASITPKALTMSRVGSERKSRLIVNVLYCPGKMTLKVGGDVNQL